MTALETFATTASKQPLTTGRRPDMAAMCAFLPSTSVITSRGIVPLPNRERAAVAAPCRNCQAAADWMGDIKHGANRRSPP